jgi:carbon monoxide dehydrogenase subunit G
MSGTSVFESRTGTVTCGARDLFEFLTDIRNFRRFIPEGTFRNIVMEKESCSFEVNMMGKVSISISEKLQFTKVVYSGNAIQINEFSLIVDFNESGLETSEVKLRIEAILNPLLRMVAADPIRKFLETLISEMEKFRDWK